MRTGSRSRCRLASALTRQPLVPIDVASRRRQDDHPRRNPPLALNESVSPAANTSTSNAAAPASDAEPDAGRHTVPDRGTRPHGRRSLARRFPIQRKDRALSITGRTGDDAGAERRRWHFGRSTRPDRLLLWDVVDYRTTDCTVGASTAPMRAVTGPSSTRALG